MIKTTIRAASILTASIGTFLHAQTFETLHQFTGDDGRRPETALTIGPDGALWGTTGAGGVSDVGVIYRYSLNEADAGFSKILDFNSNTSGRFPVARLLNIGDGNLYGAAYGGTSGQGVVNTGGTVFKITEPGLPGQQVSIIHSIASVAGTPYRAVYLASAEPGYLQVLCEDNSGVRRLKLSDNSISTPPLFPNTPKPQSFVRASNGYLYGGSLEGSGNGRLGGLFRLNPDGTGYEELHACVSDTGTRPIGAMVQAPDGNLYGLMSDGGAPGRGGVLYRLSLDGEYTPVHEFSDFRYAVADLCLASDGMLYGTCYDLGPGGNGVGGIWRIKPDGSGYKVLHVFKTAGYPTGRAPVGGLVQASDGFLYGTTQGGVDSGVGTIFRINLKLPAPPENLAPIAQDDTVTSTGEPLTIPVLANDFDPNNDPLFVEVTSTPSNGTAVVQGVSIVYTPNGGAANDTFTYRILDSRGGESTATVNITVNQVPTDIVGNYTGLMFLDEDFEGNDTDAQARWTLSVLGTGKFSGKLYTQGKTIPFKGTLDDANTAAVQVKVPGQGTATLFLNVVPGTTKSARAYFYGLHNLSGIAGINAAPDVQAKRAYTVQVTNPSAPSIMPKGLGYATMSITPQGAVTAVGKLGDGTTLKWASQLISLPGGSTFLPVFSEPTKGGRIGALLSSTAFAGRDFEGTAHWFRAPLNSPKPKPYSTGIDGEVDVRIGLYTPPAKNTLAMDFTGLGALLSDGPNGEAGNSQIAFNGTRFVPTVNLKSLSVTASTGLFSGVMKINNRSVPFKGVLNQGLRYGAGQFVISGETGKAQITD